jgi:protein-L-isoaspartate O-methyltransferase
VDRDARRVAFPAREPALPAVPPETIVMRGEDDEGDEGSAGVMAPVAERLVRAVQLLDLRPDDRVLEIGCGAGGAVSLVCARLKGGRMHAVDRSPSMAARARRRNADHLAGGKATIHTAALHEADFGAERFDVVFGIDVGLFRAHRAAEAAALRGVLAPGGSIHLFHHPPVPHRTRTLADETAAVLRDEGFAVRAVRIIPLAPVPMACVVAGVAP